MATLTFHVPGPLVTWKRTATHGGRRITPKAQREYQARVKFHAFAAMASLRQTWPRAARYAIEIHWRAATRQRADVDNAAKTVLDSLNGLAWDDDSQVDALTITRGPADKAAPGVWVTVETLENGHRRKNDGA